MTAVATAGLTIEQRAVLAGAADDWSDVAAATGAADRPAAEAALRALYRAAGLAEPERIVWYDSPLAAAVAATVVSGHCRPGDLATKGLPVRAPAGSRAGAPVRERLRTATWERARADAAAQLGPHLWGQAWTEIADRLWGPTTGLVARIRDGIEDAVAAATGGATRRDPRSGRPGGTATGPGAIAVQARNATLDTFGGQHDAAWLAAFDGLRRCFPDLPANPGLDAAAAVARAAGWWWPYERVVLVAERPVVLHRDDHARLHSGDGPALSYPDGFALHAWRGMPVPAEFVTGLGPGGGGLDATRIRNEPNAELRRVMLEIYGYDRYLADLGARPLHQDETGVLWRIDLPGDEPVVMVEVVNSTPEPDGTSRTYWLRVPPTTRTAREGVAWTFGVTEGDYRPLRET